MTTVKFLYSGNVICGFETVGHSTESAEDTEGKLVCSAISSAVYLTANTVTEIVGDNAECEVSDGHFRFNVKNPSKETAVILDGFKLHITELKKQYGKRIMIITEV